MVHSRRIPGALNARKTGAQTRPWEAIAVAFVKQQRKRALLHEAVAAIAGIPRLLAQQCLHRFPVDIPCGIVHLLGPHVYTHMAIFQGYLALVLAYLPCWGD